MISNMMRRSFSSLSSKLRRAVDDRKAAAGIAGDDMPISLFTLKPVYGRGMSILKWQIAATMGVIYW